MINKNYRFSVNASLQVMKAQREKICNDCFSGDYWIYRGLYETDDETQKLHFQYYLLKWLDDHWNEMQTILASHNEYSIDQKKEITLFFAQYFSKMIDVISKSGIMSTLMIPELLQVQKESIQTLLQYEEKWEDNSNQIRLLLSKQKTMFKRMLKK